MDNLVFGVVNKIFLAYDKPFLNPEISEVGQFLKLDFCDLKIVYYNVDNLKSYFNAGLHGPKFWLTYLR